VKATCIPSPEMAAWVEASLACPQTPSETRWVWPVCMSRTNTSWTPFVSMGTSSSAKLWKAT
jgi:hypothetical protein